MALDDPRKANRANWDERVAGHIGPDGYNIESLVTDPDYLTGVVRFDEPTLTAAAGGLDGKTLLHSQCHIGTDTLSWAKLGARVTGIDFSPKALAAARDIAAQLDVDATFVETELYDAPEHVSGQFDVVYTSVGAICWLPDLPAWAEVLASFVRPGGTFYIRDSHPALMIYEDERDDEQLVPKYPYFHRDEPMHFQNETSYSGSAKLENVDGYEWSHSVSDVVNALIGAGLRIDRLDEHQHLDWKFFPFMIERDDKWYLPDDLADKIPLQFSVLAQKPE